MKRRLLSNLKEIGLAFGSKGIIPIPEDSGLTKQQENISAKIIRETLSGLVGDTVPLVDKMLSHGNIGERIAWESLSPEEKKRRKREARQIQRARSKIAGVSDLSGSVSDESAERVLFTRALDRVFFDRVRSLHELGFQVGGKGGAVPFSERDPILMSQIARQIEALNKAQKKSIDFAKSLKQAPESKLYPDTGPSSPPRSFGGGQEHGRGAQQTPVRYLPSPELTPEQEASAYGRGAQLLNQTQLIADSQGAMQGVGRTEFNGMSIAAFANPDGSKSILASILPEVAEAAAAEIPAEYREAFSIPSRVESKYVTPEPEPCVKVELTEFSEEEIKVDWLCRYEWNHFISLPCGSCGSNGEVPATNCATYFYCPSACTCWAHAGQEKRAYEKVITDKIRFTVTDVDGTVLRNNVYTTAVTRIYQNWHLILSHGIADCPPELGGYVESGDEIWKPASPADGYPPYDYTVVVSDYSTYVNETIADFLNKLVTAGKILCS